MIDPETLKEKKKRRKCPVEDWIWSDEQVHEPIISLEVFQKAQEMIGSRKRGTTEKCNAKDGRIHLFRGMIRCGLCGKLMQPHRSHDNVYYRCRYHAEVGDAGIEKTGHPKNVFVREDVLLEEIESWFYERVFGSARLDLFEVQLEHGMQMKERERAENVGALKARLERIERKIEGYRDLKEEGADPEILVMWINEAAAERKQVREEIEAETATIPSPDQVMGLKEHLARIPDLSESLVQATPEGKRRLFSAFDLKATYDCQMDTVFVSVDVASPFGPEVEGKKNLWGLSGVGGGTRTPMGLCPTRPST